MDCPNCKHSISKIYVLKSLRKKPEPKVSRNPVGRPKKTARGFFEWPEEKRNALLADMAVRPKIKLSVIAAKHGISINKIYKWRQQIKNRPTTGI